MIKDRDFNERFYQILMDKYASPKNEFSLIKGIPPLWTKQTSEAVRQMHPGHHVRIRYRGSRPNESAHTLKKNANSFSVYLDKR